MTNDEKSEELTELKSIAKAVRVNHEKGDSDIKCILNPERELEMYNMGITRLTLPHRFGMFKTPTKDVPKFTDVQLEDPPFHPESTSSRLAGNPDHKVRPIFD